MGGLVAEGRKASRANIGDQGCFALWPRLNAKGFRAWTHGPKL